MTKHRKAQKETAEQESKVNLTKLVVPSKSQVGQKVNFMGNIYLIKIVEYGSIDINPHLCYAWGVLYEQPN